MKGVITWGLYDLNGKFHLPMVITYGIITQKGYKFWASTL